MTVTIRERAIVFLRNNGPATVFKMSKRMAITQNGLYCALRTAIKNNELAYKMIRVDLDHNFTKGQVRLYYHPDNQPKFIEWER